MTVRACDLGTVQSMGECLTNFGRAEYLRVYRHDGKPMGWEAVYETLRAVYPDGWAVQFFPPRDELVNDANVYHLYLMPPQFVPLGVNIRRKP